MGRNAICGNGLSGVPHHYYYSRQMLRVCIIVLSVHCLVNLTFMSVSLCCRRMCICYLKSDLGPSTFSRVKYEYEYIGDGDEYIAQS